MLKTTYRKTFEKDIKRIKRRCLSTYDKGTYKGQANPLGSTRNCWQELQLKTQPARSLPEHLQKQFTTFLGGEIKSLQAKLSQLNSVATRAV